MRKYLYFSILPKLLSPDCVWFTDRRVPAGPLQKNKHSKFFSPPALHLGGTFWCRGFDRNLLNLQSWRGFDPRDSPFGLIRAAKGEKEGKVEGGSNSGRGGSAYTCIRVACTRVRCAR